MKRATLIFHSVDYEKGQVYFSVHNFLYCFLCQREPQQSRGFHLGFGRSAQNGETSEMIPRNPALECFTIEPPSLSQPIPAPLRALFNALQSPILEPIARQDLLFPFWLGQVEQELGPQSFPELLYQSYFVRAWGKYTTPAEAITAERAAQEQAA